VAALGIHVENRRPNKHVARERSLGGEAVERVRGERRARQGLGSGDGLRSRRDVAVGGGDARREHAAERVEGGGGEAVLSEGGDEGGPCRGRGRRGEVEEGAEGEVRESAARVEGKEVMPEQRVGGGGGGDVSSLEEVAVELLSFGERAGGGEGDEEL